MRHRVRVTPQGARDLDHILDWLARESPQAAQRFADRFSAMVETLKLYDTSRSTRDPRYRIVNLRPYPYLVFLRRRRDDIEIIAIRHGARNPKSMPARSHQRQP